MWRVVWARSSEQDLTAIVVVASWVVTPFVLAILVSFVKPLFIADYLNVCLPAVALLTAAAIDPSSTAPVRSSG